MIINSWLRWGVSLLKFIQTLDHTDTSPYKWVSASLMNDFGNFWTVSLEAYFWSSWTLTKCSLSWKTVKYHILSEVCMINSNVSPQMWCIKSIKGWFTHSQICWQEFVKWSCRTQKFRPNLFSKNLFSRPNLLWSRAITALECGRKWLLYFGCALVVI